MGGRGKDYGGLNGVEKLGKSHFFILIYVRAPIRTYGRPGDVNGDFDIGEMLELLS